MFLISSIIVAESEIHSDILKIVKTFSYMAKKKKEKEKTIQFNYKNELVEKRSETQQIFNSKKHHFTKMLSLNDV